MNEHLEESLEELPIEEMVTVFIGDLQNCRERLLELENEEITAVIVGDIEGAVSEAGPPSLEIRVFEEDVPQVAALFEAIWKETLDLAGLEAQDHVIDLSQDTVICPGCQTEISEVTEDGECPECTLFLGFPPDEDEEDSAPDAS